MMRRILWLILFLLSATAAAADPLGPPATALSMVSEDHRAVRMVTNGDARWKIFFVVDRRLLVDVEPYDPADIAMKLRTSDRGFFEARCSSSATPVCSFTRHHDANARPLVIAATLFVIRGDGCIFSASRTDQPNHPIARHCLNGVVGKPGELSPQPMTGLWP